ncbi:unnamed protein product [Mytilus edulis]|uniref:Tyr recombinase domain-containing protein n=1 Tax=Mytilus edulis TaxID=6550 RepID=A0A8S3S262_MYTED|nr:unnamed protein product [Mytilus edulis]
MYLDDGFGTHSDINSCTDIAAQVKQDLIDSGFVPKVEKSMWSPSKTLIYLGYFIDTDKAILSIPVDRLSKLFDTIIQVEQSLRNLGKVYVRTVASVIGQIISMSYVIGNVAYIMTKYLSIDVMSACSWKSYIELSVQSKEQLIFWKKNIKCINFKHFVSDFSCHTIVYSDASGTGYGGFTVENPKNIAHEVEWIPRAENEIADYISRIIDTDDWGVAVHVFEYLDSLWGPHEIDWFASDHNHRLPVFYSRYWNVHSMGIDAFTVNWQGINGWYVPPVCLLLKVLMYMQQCNAYVTVILPLWRSANYWPFLCPKGDRFIDQVFRNDITELPNDLDSYLAIIPDLLAQSKSDNTVKKYYYGFLRWKKWAEINHISDVDILPTKPLYLALYLASLVQFSATSSPVCDAFYSIKWAHSIIGADSPTDSQLVKCVFEGAKRKLGSQIKKKEPITPELLQAMYDKLFCVEKSFSQRTICACILGYAGFMRVSELLNLRYFDINFKSSHISIFIEKSKTDIYRDGNWLIIAKTGTTLCPVRNLELYMQWSGIQSDSNLFGMYIDMVVSIKKAFV